MIATVPDIARDRSRRTTMRAIVHDRYGSPDVLRLDEVTRPVVKDDEVLVRVRAAGLNPFDWRILRADPFLVRLTFGLRRPRRLGIVGSDLAGEAEAVGAKVTGFRPGDAVFGEVQRGGCADFAAVPAHLLATMPPAATFEQAAAVPMAGMTALQGLRDRGRVQSGQHVLINGASGGVGTFAVQIAKSYGAEVTAVCSGRNAEFVRSIGADHVIDYAESDFTRGEQRFDLILDTVCNHRLSAVRRVLAPNGTFVPVGAGGGRLLGPAGYLVRSALLSPLVRQRLAPVLEKPRKEDLQFLGDLIEDGLVTPAIDRVCSLGETADAIRHLEQGHARGKVVITVQQPR